MVDKNSPWDPSYEIFAGKLIATGGNWTKFAKEFYCEDGLFGVLERNKRILEQDKIIDLRTRRELETELSKIREFASSDDADYFEHIFWGYYTTSVKMQKLGDIALSFDMRGPRINSFLPYISTPLLMNGYTIRYDEY